MKKQKVVIVVRDPGQKVCATILRATVDWSYSDGSLVEQLDEIERRRERTRDR